MKPIQAILIVIIASLAIAITAHAHGGRMDKFGCHRNRKAENYQCHRGPLVGQNFTNKAAALAALGQSQQRSSPAQAKKAPTPSSTPRTGGVPYDRKLYGGWIDADKDCQNTRQEVLIAESLIPVTLGSRGCKVVAGRWYDAFTGRYFTNPRKLDIDHFVPLAEIHRPGGTLPTRPQTKFQCEFRLQPPPLYPESQIDSQIVILRLSQTPVPHVI